MRISKNEYYLNLALECSRRGTCLQRNFGAIIVKHNQIVSTGYSGAPRGRANCCDLGRCKLNELNVPQEERFELCRSVHAEMNAIISAARWDMIDATMYINGFCVESGAVVTPCVPCEMCKRLIINAGIDSVVTTSGIHEVRDWVWDEGRDKHVLR